jgi:hypothetical protein
MRGVASRLSRLVQRSVACTYPGFTGPLPMSVWAFVARECARLAVSTHSIQQHCSMACSLYFFVRPRPHVQLLAPTELMTLFLDWQAPKVSPLHLVTSEFGTLFLFSCHGRLAARHSCKVQQLYEEASVFGASLFHAHRLVLQATSTVIPQRAPRTYLSDSAWARTPRTYERRSISARVKQVWTTPLLCAFPNSRDL